MLATLLLLLACDTGQKVDSKNESTESGGTTDSAGTGSSGFCSIKRIFNKDCVVCHSSTGKSGGLDLETDPYAALVSVTGEYGHVLVVPGDAQASFLTVKLAGTQAANEGTMMPPSKKLSAESLAMVDTWIETGATSECGADSGTTTTDTGYHYHPSGYEDPTRHGMDAKYQRDSCTNCHGTDLAGGSVGISCDSCHESGWRTNCTFCHGGVENPTGAPPEDIDDSTTSRAFSPHSEHVIQGDHPAYDCVQCHTKPTDATSAGHFILNDKTPGAAEVVFTAGLSASGSYNNGTCSNLYCHGNGQGSNGTVSASDKLACGECHGVRATGEASWERMSGEHHKHVHDVGAGCETCHGTVVDSASKIVGPDHHVDGTVDVSLPNGITYANGKCTGTCHNNNHNGRSW